MIYNIYKKDIFYS